MQMMLVKPLAGLLVAALASSGRPASHPHSRHARTLVLVSTAVAMHSIFTLYTATKPYMRGLNASRKFLSIKIVVAIILLQQLAINTLLSADIIPEGDLGYTIRDHAQRIMGTITIIEMAAFSLLLSYVFSHTSIGRPDSDDGGGSGVPRAASGELAAARRGSVNEVFELVMGDASAAAHVRKGAPISNPEAVSLWSVRRTPPLLLTCPTVHPLHSLSPGRAGPRSPLRRAWLCHGVMIYNQAVVHRTSSPVACRSACMYQGALMPVSLWSLDPRRAWIQAPAGRQLPRLASPRATCSACVLRC